MSVLSRSIGVAIALIGLSSQILGAAPARLTVKNPGETLGETPILVVIDRPMAAGTYSLKSTKDGSRLDGEVFEDGGKRYFAVVMPSIPAGDQTFELSGPIRIKDEPSIRLRNEESNVAIEVFGKPFTTHHTDIGPKPILYPLLGPTDVALTRDYPMKDVPGEDRDHPHQRSFWFTHGKVNGVDFWSEQKGHGSIKQTGTLTIRSGHSAGVLRTTDDWLGPDGAKVCEDERCLRVFATKEARVLDYDVTIKATNGPVTFGDTKEGMFGVRVASSMDVNRKKGGKITNAEGLTDLAAWGKASPWVDYTGPIGSQTLGIAILNHPESFRYPTTWHVRDYGLFAANPFGWKDFGRRESGEHTIPAGGKIAFRYRVLLHKGETASTHLEDAFRAYSHPVAVDFD